MKRTVLILAATSVALLPFAASAATVTGTLKVHTSPASTSTSVSAAAETRAKQHADQEIDRRIKNLTELSTHIGEMKRLSSADKASLSATISAQVTALEALKAQIDAETDLTALKTEIQSIAKEYRIYMLVLPQVRIAAAADKIQSATASLQAVGDKVKTRLDAYTGANASTLQGLYTDMLAKIASANTSAQAAVTETATLKPDNGDATIAAANKTALDDARAKVKSATTDLKTAVADLHKVILGIKGTGSTSSTASTSAELH